jgi:signal transduction histidine kinase
MLFVAACMCASTLVVFLFGVLFLVRDVPAIVRDERARVSAESERAAKAMRDDPALADFTWRRGEGVVRGAAEFGEYPADMAWKDWNPEGGTKHKDMWGWRAVPGGRLLWARGLGSASDTVYARFATVEERDWGLFFGFSVPAFLVVLATMTVLGVRYFFDYVRTRDDFMSATAHDLTTPLVAMRNLIGVDDAEARNLNERLLRIVRNVRDFLLLGGRRRPPERERFDLLSAYDEAYALFRDDYRDLFDGDDVARDVSALGADGGLAVVGDRTMTVQILWNLLGNDLKYAAPFGRVKAAFSRSDGFARVEFIDDGKGMSRYEMSRAFDRYYRAKTILESGKGGFGIGLSTSREFAEAMGGSLTVRANSPRGCIFTLSLPSSG